MPTIEHRMGGEPTSGDPTGTAPVREPATFCTRATVVAERRPAGSAGSTAGYHVPTPT